MFIYFSIVVMVQLWCQRGWFQLYILLGLNGEGGEGIFGRRNSRGKDMVVWKYSFFGEFNRVFLGVSILRIFKGGEQRRGEIREVSRSEIVKVFECLLSDLNFIYRRYVVRKGW